MDQKQAICNAIRLANKAKHDKDLLPQLIEAVCEVFNLMKDSDLREGDRVLLHYLANQAGIPQYYTPMLTDRMGDNENIEAEISLLTLTSLIRESALTVAENTILHRYQKEVLDQFSTDKRNRFFLSASTSFGKTFLVYEIIRKLKYKNIVLVFPTLSLLAENLFRIHMDSEYGWVKSRYMVHTMSDPKELGECNLFIFTPERFLSFSDRRPDIDFDFIFVDEVYKLDNKFIVEEEKKESERDVIYRIALHELLKDESTDALLAGPYIEVNENSNIYTSHSFQIFLDTYGFSVLNYNQYEIVLKKQFIVEKGITYNIEKDFNIRITSKKPNLQLQNLIRELINHHENAIIYCGGRAKAESKARLILRKAPMQYQMDDKVRRLVNHIEHLFKGNVGKEWVLTKALKMGIGIHHGYIPKYIQQEIISLFNEGLLNILVCTTTITEGVNTTAKNIIVMSGRKGDKPLKKFDARNIEGRAGRFMKHYKGRVFILDKEFVERINGEDEPLNHKYFDIDAEKDDIDLIMTDSPYLTEEQQQRRRDLDRMKEDSVMPKECFEQYKSIGYEDKIKLFNIVFRFTPSQRRSITEIITRYKQGKSLYCAGLELICQSILPIIKEGSSLIHFVDKKLNIKTYCPLVGAINSSIKSGFIGSVDYYLSKPENTDTAIRHAAEFTYRILRYEVVKYFGLFNLLYKHAEAKKTKVDVSETKGIDLLLRRLEYGAETQLGRIASDIGASFNVIEYYDLKEMNKDKPYLAEEKFQHLDEFERYNVEKIDNLLYN